MDLRLKNIRNEPHFRELLVWEEFEVQGGPAYKAPSNLSGLDVTQRR
jgi:hypothetical protein